MAAAMGKKGKEGERKEEEEGRRKEEEGKGGCSLGEEDTGGYRWAAVVWEEEKGIGGKRIGEKKKRIIEKREKENKG